MHRWHKWKIWHYHTNTQMTSSVHSLQENYNGKDTRSFISQDVSSFTWQRRSCHRRTKLITTIGHAYWDNVASTSMQLHDLASTLMLHCINLIYHWDSNETLSWVLGNRGIRPLISGEQGHKSLKLNGTGKQKQFLGRGNIKHQDFDFGEQEKMPIFSWKQGNRYPLREGLSDIKTFNSSSTYDLSIVNETCCDFLFLNIRTC